jgi:small neutral amino acid transporter SnatA (MarC family)
MVPVIVIAVGVLLALFGIYTLKHNPESWSYSLRTGMEYQDWSSTIYAGAFLIAGGIILHLLGF